MSYTEDVLTRKPAATWLVKMFGDAAIKAIEERLDAEMSLTPCPMCKSALGHTTTHDGISPGIIIVRCPVCGPVLSNTARKAHEVIEV